MAADPIQAAIDRAREADDRDAVFAALSPHRDRLGDDRRLAYVWAEALRTSPKRPTLRDEARAILEAWPHEPALVGRVADALLRADERPLDEPPLDPQGALLAAGALDRCSGALDPEAARDPEIGGRLLAQRAHALRLLGPGRHDEAVTLLERAIALDPDRAQWHFELGLLHKHRRDFASMRASAEHAARLEPSRGALFNLAIAATAAGDAALAKDAWDRLGIATTVREGGLPMASELAPVKVRLATRGSGLGEDALPEQAASFEAVWVQPMSPCHGVVRSATVRDAVADFGDVVLFDAAPVAILEHEGRKVPCLPLLGVLRAGGELRCRFAAMQQRDGQLEALGEALPEGARLLATAHRI
ncbi:MAG: tetratricopeptide repeat protein, partial [Sandaracinaceae bacterium]